MPEAKLIGKVRDDKKVVVKGLGGETIIDLTVDRLEESYEKTFKDY